MYHTNRAAFPNQNNFFLFSIIKNTSTLVAARKELSQANVEDADNNPEMDEEPSAIDLQDLVSAEQLEIIIGCLEEVHNVLVNANEMLVSIRCKSTQ